MVGTGSDIRAVARQYAISDNRRAWAELALTLTLYVVAAGVALASVGTWVIALPATVAWAAMTVRIYMIQHDCLHRSFFTSRKVNDLVGTLLSPLAMTPYQLTRYKHNLHHAHVSELDRRDTFEIYVMTRGEWAAAGPWRRLGYRLYRSPVTLILLGPFVVYLILRRLPIGPRQHCGWDLVAHDAMVVAMLGVIWWAAGVPGLLIWVAMVWMACVAGGLIPYVVHNFEHIHWGVKPEMDFETAALEGASVLDWGRAFDWVTMNIGYHDLHHLNARIPGYHLKAAHEALEAQGLIQSEKITFMKGLGCLRWKLYDEERQRMIGFPA